MSNRDLMKRLEALESQHGGDDVNVRHIILAPGARGTERLRVVGYTAEGITTHRQAGESVEACWERHSAKVESAYGQDRVVIGEQLTERE
ncbi:hypothetical protein [Halomonas elongata]|uniref:hypothetical protein n=1 Tax=Halomonas elongata TaxID=2746 RepID=UPI0023B12F3F|nr:hypothetical protein [Halomonas elongata]